MPAKIGTGVMDVAFDPAQIAKAGQEQVLPSFKRMAADAALAFASVKLIDINKQGVDELKQAQAAQSNVEAVIKSTGGAANVTADHIDELANSQLKLTGTDDEVIKQGAAKLLTFKQVANQVGDGNDVFDRAVKASQDLAQLGFGSVESASVLLGKALNDPIKGLTALQRVGVALTDAEKEQVKAFVASGDVLSAQKVILKEVESQVGGAADAYGKTLPGKIDIAKQSLDNMKGDLVAAEAPFIELAANGVTFLTEKLQELPDGAQAAVGSVVLLGGAAGAIVRPISDAVQIYDAWRASHEAVGAAAEATAAITTTAAAEESAAMAGVDVAATRRVVSNEALTFSEQEVATAQITRLLSLDPLIAGEGAAAGAADALAASNAELAASQLGTAASADAGAAGLLGVVGPIGLIVGAAAIGGIALGSLADHELSASDAAKDYAQAMEQAQKQTNATAEDVLAAANKVTAQKLSTDDAAKSAADAGVSWLAMGAEVSNTSDDLGRWLEVSNTAQNSTKVLAANLREAGAGSSEFGRELIGALDGGRLSVQDAQAIIRFIETLGGGLRQGKSDADAQAAALSGITGQAAPAATGLDNVNTAASSGPDAEHAKALATMLDTIKKNADNAFSSILKLAPADIRAKEGQIAIATATANVTDAQEKLDKARREGPENIAAAERELAFLRASGSDPSRIAAAEQKLTDARREGPENIAAAERDLQKAQFESQQSVLNEADALAQLADEHQKAATGTGFTAQETEDFTQGALKLLNSQLTGPTHEAIDTYIFDMEIARQKVVAWEEAQTHAVTFVPPSPAIAQGPNGQFDPRLIPPPPTTRPGIFKAAGGPVGPGQSFYGAERYAGGFEILMNEGMYQAPPKGGYVLNHRQSEQFLAARSGGVTQNVAIDMSGYRDASTAVKHAPDELRAAAVQMAVG